MPTSGETFIASYADDTVILGSSRRRDVASRKVQEHLANLEIWLRRWRVKVNPSKSTHVTFTLRPGNCPTLMLCNEPIPQEQKVKYLGLWLDRRMSWKHHYRAKRNQLNTKLKQLYPLLCPRSKLHLTQKLLIYKCLLQPVWSYGLQVVGSAALSHLRLFQRFQSKTLRLVCNAPFYVSNRTLHADLRMPFIKEVAHSMYGRFFGTLGHHQNELVRRMSTRQIPTLRRLRRSWIRDLLPQ